MKVLVTGASGFLGQYALQALHQSGIPTVAVARSRPIGLADAAYAAADLLTTDMAPLVKAAGASHLLHLAWVTEPGKYWTSALNFRWVDATTRLVEAFCEAGGQHVVVAGTCAEYDWNEGYCREDTTPLHPGTVYGVAKDATRRLVMAQCEQYQVRCAWARVFYPFGAGENPVRLVPALVEALQGRSARFGVNAGALRDYMHASDIAQGFMTLLKTQANGSYNICSGNPVRIADLVGTLAHLLNQNPNGILDMPCERLDEPAVIAGENLKLAALGWRRELSLEQGLARMLRDVRRQHHGAAVHGA